MISVTSTHPGRRWLDTDWIDVMMLVIIIIIIIIIFIVKFSSNSSGHSAFAFLFNGTYQ